MPIPTQPSRTFLSPRGRAALVELEGRRLRAYEDSAGLLTIGVGHLLTKDELDTGLIKIGGEMFPWRSGISLSQSNELLTQDLDRFEVAIMKAVTVPLNTGQRDALIIFAFNVGVAAFRKSTLLKKLNAGEYDAIPAQLRRWNKTGGIVVKGLVNRRDAEVSLWESGRTR